MPRQASTTRKTAAPAKFQAPAKSAPVKSAAQSTAQSFDFDALPAPVAVEYHRTTSGPRVNVEADTPEAIRRRLQDSYNLYMNAERTQDGKVRDYPWRTQECGTKARAAEFLRLARRYAKYCTTPEMTLRASVGSLTNEGVFYGDSDQKNPTGTAVKYMAKPRETREQK